jgi:hypothetical protein
MKFSSAEALFDIPYQEPNWKNKMKTTNRILLSTCIIMTALSATGPLQAQNASGIGVDVSFTPWIASWEQKSTAASRFGSNAINVNYEIDDAIAYDLELAIRAGSFLVSLQSIQQSDEVANRDNELSYTQVGLLAADAIAGVDIDFQHTSGEFQGFIDGAANNGNTGTGSFETDLTVQDLSVLFYKGLGVGIRRVDYELPQDLYLVNTASPNSAIVAGFQEIRYSGTFLQLVAMSENRINDDKTVKSGLSYLARYGFGTLDPGGQFLSDTNTLLRNNSQIGASESIMNEGDSTFLEVDLAYFQRFAISSADIKGSVGYRHTQWDAEFGSSAANFQLVTDFETTFSGPYVSITGEW